MLVERQQFILLILLNWQIALLMMTHDTLFALQCCGPSVRCLKSEDWMLFALCSCNPVTQSFTDWYLSLSPFHAFQPDEPA